MVLMGAIQPSPGTAQPSRTGVCVACRSIIGVRLVAVDTAFDRVTGINLGLLAPGPGRLAPSNGVGLVSGVGLGLVQAAARDLHGIGLATLGVKVRYRLRGIAVAPGYAWAGMEVRGIAAGLLAGSGGSADGLILGGLIAAVDDTLRGIALSVIFTDVGDDVSGIAASAVLLDVHDTFTGLGIAPLFHAHNMRGVSIAGFGVSQRYRGVSIAIVNYTASLRGVQLGLVNIVSDGKWRRVLPLINWR
jgi:hypothetical protein